MPGIAYAIAGLLRALPIHASRGQLYLPADLMQRYGAHPADVLRAGKETTELRAVLAELRLRARQHLSRCARGAARAAPAEALPALLPVALVRPALDRMERRGYRPFDPAELPQWRRQWALWRAARERSAHRRSDYSAASRAPPIHCSRSASARAQIARRFARSFRCRAGACRRDAGSARSASGGNRPKLTFIG